MKQVATGRKKWLFLGSPDAGDCDATLLTFISTALRHDLHVCAYLKAAIDQLQVGSTDDHSLRPEVWKLAHPQFVPVYRAEERRDLPPGLVRFPPSDVLRTPQSRVPDNSRKELQPAQHPTRSGDSARQST
jgi:hypothetical protein